MRYELKSIPIWPLTRVAFFVNLVVGFIFGIIYGFFLSFFIAVMSQLPGFETGELDMDAAGVGIGAMMVILPFLSAISSAVFGTIACIVIGFIYNLVAKMVGGIELNLNELVIQPATQYSPPPQQTAKTYTPPPPPDVRPSDNPPADENNPLS